MSYEYTRETFLYEDEIYLLTPVDVKDANGVVVRQEMKKRPVYAEMCSLMDKEFYLAYQSGIQDAMKAVLTFEDWHEGKENLVEFDGEIWTVYRRFRDGDKIELSLRKDIGTWDAKT